MTVVGREPPFTQTISCAGNLLGRSSLPGQTRPFDVAYFDGVLMDHESIAELVQQELRGATHAAPAGVTLGIPWSADKVASRVADLRQCLVSPYLQYFRLRDTVEQMRSEQQVKYWVVAVEGDFCVFYDPSARNFGLAESPGDRIIPATIGVRGDLVSTFCAI